MASVSQPRIGIYFDDPSPLSPLFDAFRRLGVAVEPIHVDELRDPDQAERFSRRLGVVLNQMHIGAAEQGRPGAITQARRFLPALEVRGVRVINGSRAFIVETDRTLQLDLIHNVGLRAPDTIEVRSPGLAYKAALSLGLREGRPVIVRPNLGAGDSGSVRLDKIEDAQALFIDGRWEPGPDGVLLVQRYHVPRERQLFRIEILGDDLHYAVRITKGSRGENLCVDRFVPPRDLLERAMLLASSAGIDVGAVEYIIDDETAAPVFLGIEAGSGFGPTGRPLADFDPALNLARFTIGQLRREPLASEAVLIDEEAA